MNLNGVMLGHPCWLLGFHDCEPPIHVGEAVLLQINGDTVAYHAGRTWDCREVFRSEHAAIHAAVGQARWLEQYHREKLDKALAAVRRLTGTPTDDEPIRITEDETCPRKDGAP